jgi:hypothetical protein
MNAELTPALLFNLFSLGNAKSNSPPLFQLLSVRLINTKSNAASHYHLLCPLISCARAGKSSACSLDSDLLNPAREINRCLCWLLPCSLASDFLLTNMPWPKTDLLFHFSLFTLIPLGWSPGILPYFL